MASTALTKLVTDARQAFLEADRALVALHAQMAAGAVALRETEKRRADLKTRLESLQALQLETKAHG